MAKPPSKPADPANDAFLREVDDAVRQSDRENFFRRYGWWLLALVVLLLAAWGGYIYWQNKKAEETGTLAESYVKSLDRLDGPVTGKRADEALTTFETIGEEGTPGYRAAGQMMTANIHAARGETTQALAIYDKVYGNTDFPQAFRDLAMVRATLLEYDTLTPDELVKQLEPLAKPGAPYFGTAGELVGLAYIDLGKTKEAGKLFTQIAKDESIPNEIRGRAQLMANKLGIDIDLNKEREKSEKAGVQQGDSVE